MASIRLPIIRDMKIASASGGVITSFSSYMQNCMVDTYSADDGTRHVVTQRPGISMVEDASSTVSKVKGRAIYYWDATNADYFINDDTIYKTDYSTVIGTITSGIKKCYFYEVGDKLVVVDPENNAVWTITTGGTLAAVTDPDLPTTIAGAAVVLDGYLFLIDNDGVIQHSDLDDATTWTATSFIEAEREADAGIGLARHHDHIVALGQSTIEFFYNAGNATGATINRRNDIFYNIGCPYEDGVWEDGDNVYFIGRTQRGDYGVYIIENFKLRIISTPEFNSFLTISYAQGSFLPLISGFAARGHSFIALTLHTIGDAITPVYTFVYDIGTSIWGVWVSSMSELSSVEGLPICAWTTSSSSRFGTGLLTNGDLISFKGDFSPTDSFNEEAYIINQDNYVLTNYIAPLAGAVLTTIDILCRMSHIDANTNKHKFGSTLEVVADYTAASQILTIKWSDTDYSTFTTTRTVDLSGRAKLSRIGKYNRRTYQLEYSGSEIVRLEYLEYDIKQGTS